VAQFLSSQARIRTMPIAHSNNAEIYYEVEGDGPAILFAHGAGGNAASWWQQVPEFRRDHRVIVFDHRGFGRSRCPTEHFSATHFDTDALAILDAEKIERAAVVCQSMGGWTGVRLAVNAPERVSALVLGNTPGAIYSDALRDQMRTLVPRAGSEDLTPMTLGAPFRDANPNGAYLYRAITAFNVTPMSVAALMARDAFVPADKLRPFPVPVLMIASDLDVTFPPELLQATARLIDAEFALIEGAGHSTYFEKPVEFNSQVRAFLTRVGSH
jgi:3-oxoadipate enol-lactonase